jgi:hypothetical protein
MLGVTDELVEFEKSPVQVPRLLVQIADRFGRIYKTYNRQLYFKTERYQHVIGWTWKYLKIS